MALGVGLEHASATLPHGEADFPVLGAHLGGGVCIEDRGGVGQTREEKSAET